MDGEKEIQNEALAENHAQVDVVEKTCKPHIKLTHRTRVILFIVYVVFSILLLSNLR